MNALPRFFTLGALAMVLLCLAEWPETVDCQPTDAPPSTAPRPPRTVTIFVQVTLEGPNIGDVLANAQNWANVQDAVRRDVADATDVDQKNVKVTHAFKTNSNSVRVDLSLTLTGVEEAASAAVKTPNLINGNASLPLTKAAVSAAGRQLTSNRIQIADADSTGFSAASTPSAMAVIVAAVSWAVLVFHFVD